jgi:hypothetical protein
VGLGPVLCKARVARGASLEEASRDTRIRVEFLQALEDEDYHRLLGDVHVRGCLRSYATYLGLPADRVMEVYGRSVEEPPVVPPAPRAPAGSDLNLRRRRDNHRLLGMVAAALLILAAAFGILSARDPAPAPAQLPSQAPVVDPNAPRGIEVTVLAHEPVDVTVRIDDGPPRTYGLEQGEGRSFEAQTWIKVRLSSGATAKVTVAGRDLGFPGVRGKPWHETFSYETETSPPPEG